jgi:GNAT superfamily N-acetyltransferase
MGIHIRKATARDMEAVHALVRELAEFEREPAAVITTPEIYRRDFEAGVFDVLVAEDGAGEVVGMVLYFTAYSTWKGKMVYLDDFVVKQALRGRGIGRMLFEALLEETEKKGVALLKWQVLDWNEPAQEFYKKYGAEIEKNWWNGKIVF